jgi:hypothetical protein
MVHLASAVIAGLLGLASIAAAHPGHDHKAEAAERRHFMRNAPVQSRSLSQCASKLKARGIEAKNVARRQNAVKHIRRRRGLSTGRSIMIGRYISHFSLLGVEGIDHVLKMPISSRLATWMPH